MYCFNFFINKVKYLLVGNIHINKYKRILKVVRRKKLVTRRHIKYMNIVEKSRENPNKLKNSLLQ